MVDKKQFHWSIGGSSFLGIFRGIGIRSFRQLFLYIRSLDIQQLVVWFQ